jgi:hypothetical protein
MTDEIIIPGVSSETIEMYCKNMEWKEAHAKKSLITRLISIFRK